MPDEKQACKENELKVLREANARWQGIRVQQVGFLTNLLTGLAAGLIALEAGIAFGKLEGVAADVKRYFLYSIILLLLSIAIGIIMSWNRLVDFRMTSRTIKLRRQRLETDDVTKRGKLTKEIDALRNMTRRLGDVTYVLLALQGIAFFVGVLALLFTVVWQLSVL
jgi:hypothetical protein